MKKLFSIFTIIFFAISAIFLGYFLSDKGDSVYKHVEIDGKKMGAHIKGSGNKTVVMLSGWGTDSPIDDFYPIWKNLSSDYKVVVLEYFGYADNGLTEKERTNENIVEEIRTALKKLEINPPYILMPHSMSGLYSLYYADKYPSEVSGIIGVDMSLPQKQLERWYEKTFEDTKENNKTQKLNVSVLNQWNAFYSNSKELENVKYPSSLPVLAFLATEQINSVDDMIKSEEMKTSWVEINSAMITNPEIQRIKILNGSHENLMYDQEKIITELSKKFIEDI